MALLRRARYWCIDPRCASALADMVYHGREYRRRDGRCSCGATLQRGEDRDLLPHALAAALAMVATAAAGVAMAPALMDWYQPPPLAHIRFVQPHSAVDDSGRVLEVEVRRDARLDAAVAVDYATADSTAREGSDYVAAHGRLHFAPGQRRQLVPITVLRDVTRQKPLRHFTLVLVNVEGRPHHRITITPPPADAADDDAAEALALSASRIAKDIADLRLKQRVADDLMQASRGDAGAYAAYRHRLAATTGDLSRARERYLQELAQLRQLPAAAALGAIDVIAERFARDGYAQQSSAARVMKRHLHELLDGGPPAMDRWAQELMDVIPRVTSPEREPTTT
ncbi:MAG: hypothetical protein AMXMBFR59_28220 [Rhodanobacteraceae bacterium]